MAPLGIKVLLVEPGPFRTDWAGRSAGEAAQLIDDYADTAGAMRRTLQGNSGQQPGDPDRAARAIVTAVNAAEPPLRLLLGKVALAGARAKLDELRRDFDAWAEVTEGADFPAADRRLRPERPLVATSVGRALCRRGVMLQPCLASFFASTSCRRAVSGPARSPFWSRST